MTMNFRFLLVMVVVAGLAAGAAFGAGTAYGRTTAPKNTTATSSSAASGQGTGLSAGGQSGSTGGVMSADFAGRGGARGTVESVDGDVLTIKGTDGATTKVKIDGKTTIRKMVDGARGDLQAGVTVIAAGDRAADGAVIATSIQVSPSSGSGSPGAPPSETPRSRPTGTGGSR